MKRLSRNLIALFASDIGRRVLGFLSLVYLTRTIGVAEFGILSLGLTVLSYAISLSSSGMHVLGTRETAKGAAVELASEIISARFLNAVTLAAAVAVVCVVAVADALTGQVITIVVSSVVVQSLLVDWYFQGKEDMPVVSAARVTSAAVYLGFIVLFVRSADDVLWAAAATLAGDAALVTVLARRFRSATGSFPLRLSLRGWLPMMRRAVPLGAGTMIGSMTVHFGTLAVGMTMTARDVGLYSAANRLVFFLLMLDRIAAPLLLPAAARLHRDSPERLAETLHVALKWIIVAALPLCLGGGVVADDLVVLILGREFAEAGLIFRILLWYFFFTMLHTVYGSAMVATGQDRAFLRVMGLSAVLYVLMVFGGIAAAGTFGAALGAVCAEAVTLVFMQRQSQHKLVVPPPDGLIRILLASMAMAFGLWWLADVHVIARILAGAAVYILLVFAMRAVTVDEVRALSRRLI